jgi:hypothetical protein
VREAPAQLKFNFRVEHHVVIVTVHWRLEALHELDAWYRAYERYFRANHQGKVDVIFDLSHFYVSPRIAERFGEIRAKMLREFTLRSYRVNAAPATVTAMYTSNVLYGAPANNFPSVEAAIAQLLKDRGQHG